MVYSLAVSTCHAAPHMLKKLVQKAASLRLILIQVEVESKIQNTVLS